jgi:hypothetical protein
MKLQELKERLKPTLFLMTKEKVDIKEYAPVDYEVAFYQKDKIEKEKPNIFDNKWIFPN